MITNGVAHVIQPKIPVWAESSPNCSGSVLLRVTKMEDLRQHWPWIERRLLILKKKNHTEKWHPGHIRNEIIKGFSGNSVTELYFSIATDNSIEGFMVLTVRADPFTQLAESLIVWLLWGNEDLIDRYLPDLCKIAKERFLDSIEFISGRRGWMLRGKAARRGFKVKSVIFRKEVL